MNDNGQPTTTLILGATGKIGGRVAGRLTAQGIAVRRGSRSAQPPFDWADSTTWAAVLPDVDAAFVSYQPDVGFPGAADVVRSFVDLAVASGVRRLVLLSGRNEEGAQLAERAVERSGAAWTIVRSSFFAQNFSESFLLDSVRAGVVAFPAGDVPEPFVDADDVADVAAAALTDHRLGGQVFEVTGPRLLTFAEAVGEVAAAAGRTIDYVPVTSEEYASALLAAGFPTDYVRDLVNLFRTVLDGRGAYVTDGVEQALGRRARDFADYVRATAATGVWDVEDVRVAG
jgi:uncharacterized protein YbjT (DUF2867 family)